jgi:hypothetical protein
MKLGLIQTPSKFSDHPLLWDAPDTVFAGYPANQIAGY